MRLCCSSVSIFNTQVLSRSAFFWQKKDEDVKDEAEQPERRKMTQQDGITTAAYMQTLKSKSSIRTVRGYNPPEDVSERVRAIASELVDEQDGDWQKTSLQERNLKFKLLSRCFREFHHVVPSHKLVAMATVGDVVEFYRRPVKDASSLEDLTRQQLPRNLHVQLDPLRFHPDTDTFFGGKTAFPDRPTVVSSIKYRHKYKGTEE